MSFTHTPVLVHDVLRFLNPQDGKTYIDATFGRGGYSRAILDAANCTVFAIDRDKQAIKQGAALKNQYKNRLHLIHGRFSNLSGLLALHGIEKVDGIVFDLGVSSPQLDDPNRGFSFQKEGPLDMRMGESDLSAEIFINTAPEKELTDVIRKYGEEKHARRIARDIVNRRKESSIKTTTELADIVRQAQPASRPVHKEKIDPATRTFQAVRIHVNQELQELKQGLTASEKLLQPGGVLIVVSFHSLEDRIVKVFFKDRSASTATTSRLLPGETAPAAPTFELLTRKPIRADDEETGNNPRARSAKLRAARRIEATTGGVR